MTPLRLQAEGVALFLFIPLVLFLFVRHPEPVAASLAGGIALMLSHRFLARPYMARAARAKCLWCNRVAAAERLGPPLVLAAGGAGAAGAEAGGTGGGGGVEAEAGETGRGGEAGAGATGGGGAVSAVCCRDHRRSAARFLRFVARMRWPLRLGIFLPLVLLLAALAAAAAGHPARLPAATALFQLAVGATVSLAAWGYLLAPEDEAGQSGGGAEGEAPIEVPFPAHNFFLLGLATLLWIFRLIGAWWIWRGASFFL